MADPDFDALRAERNSGAEKIILEMAAEMGIDPARLRTTFDPNMCYCDCPGGLCEHKWDGPIYVSEDQCVHSTTCSRCGIPSFSHDMRVLP